MENIYAIHAYESHFQGLHGAESFEVIEAYDDEEAKSYAQELADDIIDSCEYEHIEGEEIWRCCEIYKLTEETNASLEELNAEWDNDPEDFLNKYANKQIY